MLKIPRPAVAHAVLLTLALQTTTPIPLEAQFWKRIKETAKSTVERAGCNAATQAGHSLGKALAEFETKRLKLSPAEAQARAKAFEIGLAMDLCETSTVLVGTSFAKLSNRGREAREEAVMEALENAEPRVYKDPERASLAGQVTLQPTFASGDEECRIVEDHLADGAQNDEALLKYCRTGDGPWKLKKV